MARTLEYIEHHFDGTFDLWRQHLGAMFDAAPILSTDETTPFRARVYLHRYGAIERASYGAVMFDHAAHHAEASRKLISVTRYPVGGPVDQHIRLSPDLRPRTLHLFDHSATYKSFHFQTELENIYILKSAIGLADTDQVRPRRFLPGTPLADLLNSEMDRVFAPIEDTPPVFSDLAFRRLMVCVRAALRGRTTVGRYQALAREAVLDLIRDHIHANLGEKWLGPRDLINRFGVSRPTLYRMFKPYGGVRAYIAHHRLFHAAYDLSTRDTRRGVIADVAKRWGFTSSLQFNRAIHNVFGAAPTELFRAPLTPPPVVRQFDYLKGFIDPPS